MTDEPIVWHYGLMAERWARFVRDVPELPYIRQAIAQYGEPVLDVACGTGRLLLPLLRFGIDIDGCDVSSDMLEHCRHQIKQENLHPRLVNQSMDGFEMGRRYRTIYLCDSFGLAGSRRRDLAALKRCYEHLEMGGALLMNIQAEYTCSRDWSAWLSEGRQRLPEPWPQEGSRRVAPDDEENIAYFRLAAIDPLDQRYVRDVRIEKKVSGKIVGVEEYTLQGNMYMQHEVRLMLEIVGFQFISLTGDYTDVPANAQHEELNFVAIK